MARALTDRPHRLNQIPRRDTFAENNLLSRGREIAVEVDDSDAVDLILDAGEMSLHHVRLIHGSAPNRADQPRIGYRNFLAEPVPRFDFDPAAAAFYTAMLENNTRILYAGAERRPDYNAPPA